MLCKFKQTKDRRLLVLSEGLSNTDEVPVPKGTPDATCGFEPGIFCMRVAASAAPKT